MESAINNYLEVGQILIEKGANVNAVSNTPFMDTALIMATFKGNIEFVELLLNK